MPAGRAGRGPMCGSGTTLVAAKRMGRRWLGVDLDRQAAKIAQARLRLVEPKEA